MIPIGVLIGITILTLFRQEVVDHARQPGHVLIAGLLTRSADSPTVRWLDAMLDGSLFFLLSPALLAEYRTVSLRPRIAAAHGLTEAEIDALLTEITANAIWREPQAAPAMSPDAGDTHLWALLACEVNAVLIEMRVKPRPSGRGRIARTPEVSFRGG